MPLELASALSYAEAVAREAGLLLRRPHEQLMRVNAIDAHDVKMQADLESEKLIRKRLEGGRAGNAVPGLPVIGEEHGGDAALLEAHEPYWVVDPLDGTFNYLRGQRQCCVSIGLMRGREPLVGVIHDFHGNETVTGLAGEAGSLRLNGEPVTPRWAEAVERACLCTGFPAGMDYSDEALRVFISRIQRFKKVRMLGSAALALACVALGRADVYVEPSINLWDVAAGLSLVHAGGGHCVLDPVPGKPLALDCYAAGRPEWIEAVRDGPVAPQACGGEAGAATTEKPRDAHERG
jgi:myo-inositol-1(or 4)-monophosphatase